MKTIRRSLLCCLAILLALSVFARAPVPPALDLTLTESEWLTPNIIRIPFTLTGTLITVRARVDTLEGNFFFDTGSSGLLLNYRHWNPQYTTTASLQGGGVTGQVRVAGATRIDTFLLDNMLVTSVPGEWIDLSHIENSKKIDLVGIIGYRVFEGYEVLFDYGASRLVLIRTDAKGNPLEELPNWEYQLLNNFPLLVVGHAAVLTLQFGNKSRKMFVLDSGAEQNLLSFYSGKRFLKCNFEIRKRVRLNGVGQASVEVLSGVLQNARIDTFQLQPMATLLTNLNEINTIYQTNVDGVLGYEFLSQRPVSINYKKRRLRFYSRSRP